MRSLALVLLLALGAPLCAAAQGASGQGAAGRGQAGPAILVVDQRKVLESSAAGRALEAAEQQARAVVQSRLDAVKEALEAEERSLAERREGMPADAFARLGVEFDRKVREERRSAQERGALLLKFLDDGRGALRAQLPRAIEELRRRTGASVILDVGAAAAWDADVDATADAAAIFDEMTRNLRFDPPARLLEP